MSNDVDPVFRLLESKSSARTLVGWYRGLDDDRMTVDVGGGRFPAYPLTGYRPAINERVTVWIIDDVPFLVGPIVSHPVDGTIVSTASGIATVSTDQGNVSATYPLGASYSGGEAVRLQWGGDRPHVIGVKSTSPTAPDPGEDPGGGGVKTYSPTFRARYDSGSYGSSWFTNRIYSSISNLGAWFYGNKIRDTIPSDAEILKVEIYLAPAKLFGDPANIGVHNHASRPAGSPTISSTSAVAPHAGWNTLPNSVGDALKSGGSARGIGIVHGGYHIFLSPTEDGESGKLRITYKA
ncbi:hypothetical protein [Agromyces sp. SYSU T00194]|uniref:hypothetical protein n=1 Tax=Agromyces chitinivorans TaxID=3158560 RepID=UPI003390FF40